MTSQICNIRKAVAEDLPAIYGIYDEIHTAEESGNTTIGWVREVYPTAGTARKAFHDGELFVLEVEQKILGAAIINQRQADAYKGAAWSQDVPDEKIMVLHTLVISPKTTGHGFGQKFVAFYEAYALANGCPYLRMDTNARNSRARDMYQKLGYREIGIVPTVFNGIEDVQLVLLEKTLC